MEKSKSEKVKTSMLRAGRRTIFFDVSKASNDKHYLKITESRFVGEGDEKVRNSLVLFPEDVVGFQQNLKDIVGYL